MKTALAIVLVGLAAIILGSYLALGLLGLATSVAALALYLIVGHLTTRRR